MTKGCKSSDCPSFPLDYAHTGQEVAVFALKFNAFLANATSSRIPDGFSTRRVTAGEGVSRDHLSEHKTHC
jgi:hypothetical protein